MSFVKHYNPLFDPKNTSPFKLSRSKIDLFINCPRCFYLDRRLGIARPSIPGFSLNNAVDHLLKKEFDLLRYKGETHALIEEYEIDAIPYKHQELDVWRDPFKGITHIDSDSNLLITGGIDDIWRNSHGKLLIVDYKATSTEKEITLDDKWKQSYKRQMEIYQWLFKEEGFDVSDMGYFVFANAGKNKPTFDGVLEFKLSIIPYRGKTEWIPKTLLKIRKTLTSNKVPDYNLECEHCIFALKSNQKDK